MEPLTDYERKHQGTQSCPLPMGWHTERLQGAMW